MGRWTLFLVSLLKEVIERSSFYANQMNKRINWDLISKVLTNKANEKETRRFSKWLHQDAENTSLFNDLVAYIEGEEDMQKSVKAYDALNITASSPNKFKQENQSKRFLPLKIAASILIFLSLSYTAVLHWDDISSAVTPVAYTETVTPTGSRMHLELEDGTRVWLNAASKIVYPEKFSKKTREVFLSGEAYFEVAHHKNRPFIVKTANLETTVLGTTFNINAYESQGYESITLISGKVKLDRVHVDAEDGRYSALYLGANEKAVFAKNSGAMRAVAITDAPDSKAWTEGRLIFKQAKMADIIEVLNRKYNVDIRTENSEITQCRISAKFNDQHLGKTLQLLALAAGIHYEINGKKIILYGNGCK